MSALEKSLVLVAAFGAYFLIFGGLHALPVCRLQQRLLKWAGLVGAVAAGGYAMSPGLIDKHVPIVGYADNVLALFAFAFSATTFWFARKELAAGLRPALPAASAA
jgi:hypothetical protein